MRARDESRNVDPDQGAVTPAPGKGRPASALWSQAPR